MTTGHMRMAMSNAFPLDTNTAYLLIRLSVFPWFVLSLVGGISIGVVILINRFFVFYSSTTLLGSIQYNTLTMGCARRLLGDPVWAHWRIHTCETYLVSMAGSAACRALLSRYPSTVAGKKTTAVPLRGDTCRFMTGNSVCPPWTQSLRYTKTVTTRWPPFWANRRPSSLLRSNASKCCGFRNKYSKKMKLKKNASEWVV
jgi:hypothetical protein